MSNIPTLVQLDPWLESNQSEIEDRIESFQREIESIRSEHSSLIRYANQHNKLGIHFDEKNSQWIFNEWAPAAQRIELVGDFNQWDGVAYAFTKDSSGFWSLSVPSGSLRHQSLFKLRITGADGITNDRIPAYITRVIQDEDTHDFSAQIWQPPHPYIWKYDFDPGSIITPLIYEAHIGMAGESQWMHTYNEFTTNILPRIKKLGYNVIQLMAIQEHPYYGSFGYHVSNFFAASSKFGTPEQLKTLIDTAHGLGIAVLLDVVHSHAVKNTAEGLNNFDGSGHQYFKE